MDALAQPRTARRLPAGVRAGLEAVSAPLMAHDGECIVFANDAMLRLLGCGAQGLLQLAPEAWAAPAQQPMLREYGRRCLESTDALPAFEIEAVSASGTHRHLEITTRRLHAAAGEPPLVLLTCQDLSDMRHVQNSLLEVGRVTYQIVENGPVASSQAARHRGCWAARKPGGPSMPKRSPRWPS